MRDRDLTSKDIAALESPMDLMEQEWAPCRYHCPVHADVRKYLEYAAAGQLRESADVIRHHLPFATVCGRICHHPCETNCRRDGVDESVAIREVKRFVVETVGTDATVAKPGKTNGARVAIVGGGPSGMSAALELARNGYQPTVFEKFDVVGGIPRTAIPSYRLPDDVLAIDTDWICAHGVEVVTGCEVGKDKTVADLSAEGFEAIIIAAGLASSRMLPLPGTDHERVMPVLDFLTKVRFGEDPAIGENVLVVGGGNVAMDAARTAVRCGASVQVMMLESMDEMPAWSWEYDEAHEEGVGFHFRRGPVEVTVAESKVTGMKHRGVTAVFDADGKFAPSYDDADTGVFECDTVIMAIGQMADMGFSEGSGLSLNDRGGLSWDEATCLAGDNVFACGEIVTKPGSVVEACRSGQRAASAVMQHLKGDTIVIDDELPPSIDVICESTADKVLKVDRNPVPTEDAAKRCGNFDPIDHNLDAAVAVREARRCMSCGGGAEVIVDKCAACLTCLRVCPFDIPDVKEVARIDSAKCQSCGICIAACPANAIVPRSWSIKDAAEDLAAKLASVSGPRKVVAFISGFRAEPGEWTNGPGQVDGVIEVYLPSVSRVSSQQILHAFESGATGVVVVATGAEGVDRYPDVADRVSRHVTQVQELLGEIGMNAKAVQFISEADHGRESITAGLAAAVDVIEGKEDSE